MRVMPSMNLNHSLIMSGIYFSASIVSIQIIGEPIDGEMIMNHLRQMVKMQFDATNTHKGNRHFS